MELNLSESGNQLSEADLSAVEERYGFKFPDEYKVFLLKHNGGKPDRNLIRLKGKREYTECVHYFLSISNDPDLSFEEHLRAYKVEHRRLAANVIPIGYDPGGNLICIAISGRNKGKVYFWDHECETSGRGARGENMGLIADSFQEFIDGLKEE